MIKDSNEIRDNSFIDYNKRRDIRHKELKNLLEQLTDINTSLIPHDLEIKLERINTHK